MERLALFAIFAAICLLTVAGGAIALAQDATGGRFAAAAVLAAVCGGAVCVVLMVGSARRPDRSSGRGWILAVAAAGGAGSLLSALTGLWEAIILGFMGGFALTWVPVLAYLAMRRRSGDWRQRSSESCQGRPLINMTAYPEGHLARELELCYANISMVTDHDVGVEGTPPVTHEAVINVSNENNDRLRELLFGVVPEDRPAARRRLRNRPKGARVD